MDQAPAWNWWADLVSVIIRCLLAIARWLHAVAYWIERRYAPVAQPEPIAVESLEPVIQEAIAPPVISEAERELLDTIVIMETPRAGSGPQRAGATLRDLSQRFPGVPLRQLLPLIALASRSER